MSGKLLTRIKQTKPFRSLEEEAFLNIVRTADALMQAQDVVLSDHNLSHSQYNVLRILRGAGTEGLPCGEIGNRMISRDPDITRLLDRLEKRGLAQRSREAKDRRVVTTRITQAGLDLLSTLDKPMESMGKKALGHLNHDDLKLLIELMERAREQVE